MNKFKEFFSAPKHDIKSLSTRVYRRRAMLVIIYLFIIPYYSEIHERSQSIEEEREVKALFLETKALESKLRRLKAEKEKNSEHLQVTRDN